MGAGWNQRRNHDPDIPDDRRLASGEPGKGKLVAPEEIAIVAINVVASSYGISLRDASTAVARLLGFMRVTEDMRNRIEFVIRQMLRREQLVQQGNHLVLPRRDDTR